MTPDELQLRTKDFSLRVMKVVDALPNSITSREIGRQLVRAGMSVSANYRAARRAGSKKEFAAKIGIVVEEVDEASHWLDLLIDSELLQKQRLEPLLTEASELTRIFARTRRTARSNQSPNRQITKSPDTHTAAQASGTMPQ